MKHLQLLFQRRYRSGNFPFLCEAKEASYAEEVMSAKLENYLPTYRNRSAPSQSELAFVLGSQNKINISRYEHFGRLPNVETALAYDAIFGVPAGELFGGIKQKVERKTKHRAQLLARKLSRATLTSMATRKLETLQ